jgi:membrane protein DedA with SNARE-associated domain
MRFKTGIVVGMAAGYVLGARAGRERYQQIKSLSAEAMKHPAVAQLAHQTGGLLDAARYVASSTLSTGARVLRATDARSG